jgi:cell division septation protein DedD
MKVMRRFTILILSLMLTACSSSSETATDSEDTGAQEVYVFDDVTEDTVEPAEAGEVEAAAPVSTENTVEEPETTVGKSVDFYIVQLGAFTSEARAQSFMKENKDKIEYEMSMHYSEAVKLYVVQLPPFRSREKAEEVRNALWSTGRYNDAFIVPD